MVETLPTTLGQLRQLASVHGGYYRLFRWGGYFYGTKPLLRAARLRLRATSSGTILISGTQGKTTALRMIRQVLGLPLDAWSDSNTNVRGEVPWTVLREPRGAPLIPLEVGDGVGALPAFAAYLEPRMAVLLNVGQEHLAALRDLESAADELAVLLAALPEDGVAMLNHDDAHVRGLASPISTEVVWFGHDEGCAVRIRDEGRGPDGRLWVDVEVDGSVHRVATRLVGLHYAAAVAASVAVGLRCGIPIREVAARLAGLPPTPSRLEPMRSTKGATILSDDFKATPETVHAGLAEVAAWPAGRRWIILGDLTNLPDAEVTRHYADVARHAAEAGDEVVTVGDEWGSMSPAWQGLPISSRHAESFAAAVAIVADEHAEDDLIYVKGCEDTRIRRVSLALAGYDVRCAKPECKIVQVLCESCPALGRG